METITKKPLTIPREVLSLEDYTHFSEFSVDEFIVLFMTTLNDAHDTLDEEGALHTGIKRLRSLGDIYNICKTYYPDVTAEEIKEKLLSLGSQLVGHYCGNIKKRIYAHLHNYPGYCQISTEYHDEYGNNVSYNTGKSLLPLYINVIAKYNKLLSK